MDLDGFEPSTSSMPFKKYQSLTDSSARNKRVSTRPRGRHGGAFWGVWTPRGLQDATRRLARGVLSRARLRAVVIVVCWSRQQLISL